MSDDLESDETYDGLSDLRSDLTRQKEISEYVSGLVAALKWYGEQARLCRLIHSEGDAGRHAIQADGGKRASEALSK